MSILRNLTSFNVPTSDLIHVYVLYIRSVLEQSSVLWSSSLTESDSSAIERAQKCALRNIFGASYKSYSASLIRSQLPTLKTRRALLNERFSEKCIRNPKTSDMFPQNEKVYNSRKTEKFKVQHARSERLAKSALPMMARALNSKYSI